MFVLTDLAGGKALIQKADSFNGTAMNANSGNRSSRRPPASGDAPRGDSGDTRSRSDLTVSTKRMYAMHGLLLSSIELALTVGNAVNRKAFQLNSFSDLIFGGSVVIEAVGLVFAMGMALRMFMHPMAQGMVGVGVPAMVIVETMVMTGSTEDIDNLCLLGLGAQSLCFLVFTAVSWIESPPSVPTASAVSWVYMAVACAVLFFFCYKRHEDGHSTTYVFQSIFVAVPFVVEIAESALLFTSGHIPFVAYLLAVLDLVIIAPAALIIFFAVAMYLIEMLSSG